MSSIDRDLVRLHIVNTADSLMTAYQCRNIVICGDLNMTNFDIAVILNELNLQNAVKEITRPASGTTLDVVLVSEDLYTSALMSRLVLHYNVMELKALLLTIVSSEQRLCVIIHRLLNHILFMI